VTTFNVLSIDLEFWVSRVLELEFPSRRDDPAINLVFEETVIKPVEMLLKLFSASSTKTTFFINNSIFEAAPGR